jgi:Brp/Blh family beta-carotene 15,15'-monooxygenase
MFFSALFLGTLFLQKKYGYLKEISLYQIIQFACLLAILIFLPLVLAFTFYFALWHSILSVRNIFSYFKNFNTGKKFTVICGKSLLFSFLAIGSIFILYYFIQLYIPNFNLLFSLLIILSVLTLPHLTVMHRMYQNSAKIAN